MALTGRAAIAALIGTLVTLAFRDIPALVIVDALIAAAIITDCVLAAGVRQLQVSRSGDARIQDDSAARFCTNGAWNGCRPVMLSTSKPLRSTR